jgi:uncharacterized protein YkwD
MKKNTQKKNKIVSIALGLLLALVFVLPVEASEINAKNIVKLVNEARLEQGLKALRVNEKLMAVAQAKANDMAEQHYFAHTSPKGIDPWYWFGKIDYDYKYAGENLAINFTTAEAQQAAWMKSPTHKKNILNVNYQEIGVAVVAGEVNGKLGIIAVQEFGTLAHPEDKGKGKEVAPIEDKDFSEVEKFVPTVLSTGDQKVDQKVNEKLRKIGEQITAPKSNWTLADGAGDTFWLVLFGLIFLPIMIVQIVFAGKTVGVSWFRTILQNSGATAKIKNSQEYFRKLKVKDKGRRYVIRVRIAAA